MFARGHTKQQKQKIKQVREFAPLGHSTPPAASSKRDYLYHFSTLIGPHSAVKALHTALLLPTLSWSRQPRQSQTSQFTRVSSQSPARKSKAVCIPTRFCFRCKKKKIIPSLFYNIFSATHPQTKQAARTASKTAESHLRTSSHCKKQYLTLTDLVRRSLLTLSRSDVLTAAKGSHATHLFTAQTKRLRSDKPLSSHSCTFFSRSNQHSALTELYHLALLAFY